jgi:Concanavalin A-like lectin/glucanases superfamily
MRTSRPFGFRSLLSSACATGTLACLAALTPAPALHAQAQLQAYYPLLTDLLDVTTNYGPVSLLGNPPPAAPNNGVCVNGIYFYNSGGQDVQTPLLTSLDTTDFEIDVDFNITALPSFQAPVIMGGHLWRWLGIYLQSNGTIGIKYNNSNLTWSSTVVTTGVWYSAQLKFEAGITQLFLNGSLVHQATVGPLSDGNNKNITTNDYSNGLAFNGCIRNLLVLNNTTIVATAVPFGTGCAGSAGLPDLAAANTPQFGTTFTLNATNLEPNAPFALMAVGFSDTASVFGPLPFNLQALGLGAGCSLLVSTDAMVLFGAAGGSGAFNLGIPANPANIGFRLFFQCASFDPGAMGGVAVSNGVNASIGY